MFFHTGRKSFWRRWLLHNYFNVKIVYNLWTRALRRSHLADEAVELSDQALHKVGGLLLRFP